MLGFGFGTQELLILGGIIVLLFGGAKLPGLMRNLGRSITEFKAGVKEQPKEASAIEEKDSEGS